MTCVPAFLIRLCPGGSEGRIIPVKLLQVLLVQHQVLRCLKRFPRKFARICKRRLGAEQLKKWELAELDWWGLGDVQDWRRNPSRNRLHSCKVLSSSCMLWLYFYKMWENNHNNWDFYNSGFGERCFGIFGFIHLLLPQNIALSIFLFKLK